MDQVKQRWLSRLPDVPRWVETRDLLSLKGSVAVENTARSGFVVWSDDFGSIVGEPDPAALARAAVEVSELLAFPENVEKVRAILRDFTAEPAAVLSAPVQLPPSPPHPCRTIGHASETETLWDVSIDTVESHRRRGYAAAAVLHLMRLMKEKGKAAVWGAAASNPASRNLALRLGFIEVATVWVLTRGAG